MTTTTGTPKRQDIEIPRGDDRVIRVTLEENGSVAGWSFQFAVRRERDEPDAVTPVISRSSGISASVTGDENTPAVIDITVTDDETLELGKRPYWWSLKRADAGFETTLVHGVLSMTNTAAR